MSRPLYLIVERLAKGAVSVDGLERKVLVVKDAISAQDREWIADGRSFVIRLSDMKVSKWVNGRLLWRRDPVMAGAVYDGRFVIAEALL